MLAGENNVVAGKRRDRQVIDVGQIELRGEVPIFGGDALEHRLVVADQVHLVHRKHDAADAEQPNDVTVAPRLGEDSLARVHQHHREIGSGCAGGHVAGVLLVAGGVGDDELAPFGGEIPVRHVDGDPLLALRLQAIEEKGEIGHAVRRAGLAADARQFAQLIVENRLGIVEQAPDHGALAVVDAAAGDEAQHALGFVARKKRLEFGIFDCGGRAHQKYPSRFFFSIDPDWS